MSNREAYKLMKTKTKRKQGVFRKMINSWQLYLMALPAMLLLFAFSYMPMGGIIIAFKNYRLRDGILGSKWQDPLFRNFSILFNNPTALRALRNTILLNLLFITVGTIFALLLTLAINEIVQKRLKKLCQSLTFLPFFISTVVVGVFVSGMLGFEGGTINRLLISWGFDRINFFSSPALWPWILLIIKIWMGAGHTAVIYLATIAGIDETYYEAARLDGASRMQQIKHITLPLLKPTVIIMLLLAVGGIVKADFGFFYNITQDVPLLHSTTDVLDTFIFRALRTTGDIGISSAAGLFQSVVGLVMVLTMNYIARKYESDSALF